MSIQKDIDQMTASEVEEACNEAMSRLNPMDQLEIMRDPSLSIGDSLVLRRAKKLYSRNLELKKMSGGVVPGKDGSLFHHPV